MSLEKNCPGKEADSSFAFEFNVESPRAQEGKGCSVITVKRDIIAQEIKGESNMKKGYFITFEGPDGSGKTTVSTAGGKAAAGSRWRSVRIYPGTRGIETRNKSAA